MISKINNNSKVEYIFDGWEESTIWSSLQGVMGEVYADGQENPTCAMSLMGDFIFFAGNPSEELAKYVPEIFKKDFAIMVPQNDQWGKVIEEVYVENSKKVSRYSIKKEKDIFDKGKLQKIVEGLQEQYTLKLIDEDIYNLCKTVDWCNDFVSQYETYEMYNKLGLGVVIMKDGEIISGASSYSSYNAGIEIEIATHREYRRQGLAYICGAKIILECIKRNWYPSWDAHNKWSVALAEKLGYHYKEEYTAYEVELNQ